MIIWKNWSSHPTWFKSLSYHVLYPLTSLILLAVQSALYNDSNTSPTQIKSLPLFSYTNLFFRNDDSSNDLSHTENDYSNDPSHAAIDDSDDPSHTEVDDSDDLSQAEVDESDDPSQAEIDDDLNIF